MSDAGGPRIHYRHNLPGQITQVRANDLVFVQNARYRPFGALAAIDFGHGSGQPSTMIATRPSPPFEARP